MATNATIASSLTHSLAHSLTRSLIRSLTDAFTDLPDDTLSADRRRVIRVLVYRHRPLLAVATFVRGSDCL